MIQKLTEQEAVVATDQLNSRAKIPWQREEDYLVKSIVFDDFAEAIGFMATVAIHADKQNHHPDWCNIYRRVEIRLTTHEAGGLTLRDFKLAGTIERILASNTGA